MLFKQLWLTILAWIGIAVIVGFVASLVIAVTGLRVPHPPRRWRPSVLLARLRARNERIIREREDRRG